MTGRIPTLKYHADQLTRVWQSASLLLDYPTEQLTDQLDLFDQVARSLPTDLGGPLAATLFHLRTARLSSLQSEYVETFDNRRRGCMFLTYFSNGETRKRGLALLRIKQVYTKAGLNMREDELPDHLCVVLEFAAITDQRAGLKILLDNRAGLELLRLHLTEINSPWAGVLQAVCKTLPALKGKENEAIQRLAAEGPPDEEVGLEPYGAAPMTSTPGGMA